MTFHKSDRVEYVCSGCKLSKETLKTLVEYFELIYNSCLSQDLVPCRRLEKTQANAKHEMRHELQEQYDRKLAILRSSPGPTGCAAHDVTMDFVDANMISVATARDTPTICARRRVPPLARTRVLSPATCMVSTLGILMKIAAGTVHSGRQSAWKQKRQTRAPLP